MTLETDMTALKARSGGLEDRLKFIHRPPGIQYADPTSNPMPAARDPGVAEKGQQDRSHQGLPGTDRCQARRSQGSDRPGGAIHKVGEAFA